MLTLYHAAGAVCAAKVRIVLAEKNLPYESHLLDLQRGDQFDAAYIRLNPAAVVPTLVDDGRVLHESTVIVEYLDDAYPQPPLRSADPYDRARSHLWTRREDSIHGVVNTFTSIAVLGPELLRKSAAEREAAFARIPSLVRRTKFRELVEAGAASPVVLDDAIQFTHHLHRMDAALATDLWLSGGHFGLADAGLISFLHRFELLGYSWIWNGSFSRVAGWFAACKHRQSFEKAIGAFTPPQAVSRFLEAGKRCATDVQAVFANAAEIAIRQ